MGDHHAHSATMRRRALWIALGLNAVLLVAETIGGFVFASLALLADAAHMLSDVSGLGIALMAHALAARPSTHRHTFGLHRAEVVGAQANAVILIASSGWIGWAAVGRLRDPATVDGTGLLAVAVAGLAANLIAARIVHNHAGDNLNMRGAVLHLMADALGSAAAIAAGVAVVVADAHWVDPAASLVVAALVLHSAWTLLRRATSVLINAAPADLDATELTRSIDAVPGVVESHHLHIWSIGSEVPAVSAHVVVAEDLMLHDAQHVGDAVRAVLAERHGISHATLELECHDCEERRDH